MCTGVNGIDLPIVNAEVETAKRGNGIDEKEGAGIVDDSGDFLKGLVRSGRRFGVDDGEDFGLGVLFEGVCDLPGVVGLAPIDFEGVGNGAVSLGDIGHACAKDTVDAGDDVVAGFDEVCEAGFHAGRAGA